jgi:hypothetical protein
MGETTISQPQANGRVVSPGAKASGSPKRAEQQKLLLSGVANTF